MNVYLPIAEMSVNALLLLGLGGGVGLLSGMFGVGGGFLLTPLLIFVGVPAPIAVASQSAQLVASSVSGALAQWRRNNVDLKMGWVMVFGGLIGSLIGVQIFSWLKAIGQIDIVIALSYVVFLGIVGGLMLVESLRAMFASGEKAGRRHRGRGRSPLLRLPLKTRFRRSKIYVSALAPALIGMSIGFLAALLGIGGGFMLVPAMIYLLAVPTGVSIGTSLFNIACISAIVAFLHAIETQTVDVVLAAILLVGSTLGAQLGARLGARLKGEHLRGLLALVVLSVAAKLIFDLVSPPADPFSLEIIG